MRKILGLIVVCTLMLGVSVALAQDKKGPVDQLTGKVWVETSEENKQAFLFGVECVIAIDHAIAEKMISQKGTPAKKKTPQGNYAVSPFEKAWAEAFKGVSRESIVDAVDKWYKENPARLERPVFDVIWYEIIQPKLKKG